MLLPAHVVPRALIDPRRVGAVVALRRADPVLAGELGLLGRRVIEHVAEADGALRHGERSAVNMLSDRELMATIRHLMKALGEDRYDDDGTT